MSGGSDKQSSLFDEITSRFGRSAILGPTRATPQRECIGIPWFPECRLGVLYHDAEKDQWHQSAPGSDPEENLIINIQDNGIVSLHPGDDDGQYLRTSIHSAAELLELMSFFESADADHLHPGNSAEIPLLSVVDKVFLLVLGGAPDKATLRELAGSYMDAISPKLADFLDPHFAISGTAKFEELSQRLGAQIGASEVGAAQTLFGDKSIWPSQSGASSLDAGDLIFDAKFGWRTAGEFLRNAQPGFAEAPSLVVRLKDTFSKMYFSDFVRLMPEGSSLGAQLTAGWKTMGETLNKARIAAPGNKLDQVARSVSLRSRAEKPANAA